MKTRKGFSVVSLIMSLALVGAIGLATQPSISNYYDKMRVENLVEKEKLLKNLYEIYYKNSGGNLSLVPSTIDALITKAQTDKLIPISFTKENGFGGDIEFSVDGAIISIGTEIPSEKIYAKNIYSSILSASSVGYVSDGTKSFHVFSMTGTILEHTAMQATFADKASTAGATVASTTDLAAIKTQVDAGNVDTSTLAGQTWWDYDPTTDTYAQYSWDTTTSDFKLDGTYSANVNSSIVNNAQKYVGTTDSIDAKTVVEGSQLIDNSSGVIKTYYAINGNWVLDPTAVFEGGTTTTTDPSTVAGSEGATTVDYANGDYIYEVADSIDNLLNRAETNNWFYAAARSKVMVPGLFGTNVEFTKWSKFWTSDVQQLVPNYADGGATNIERTIYIAPSVLELPPATDGSIAYVMTNNDCKTAENKGYCGGVQEDTSTTYEMVYIGSEWIDIVPTVSDLILKANRTLNHAVWVMETNSLFVNMGMPTDQTTGYTYWEEAGTSDKKIQVTRGDRTNLPIPTESTKKYTKISYEVGDEILDGSPIYSNFVKYALDGSIDGNLIKWSTVPGDYRDMGLFPWAVPTVTDIYTGLDDGKWIIPSAGNVIYITNPIHTIHYPLVGVRLDDFALTSTLQLQTGAAGYTTTIADSGYSNMLGVTSYIVSSGTYRVSIMARFVNADTGSPLFYHSVSTSSTTWRYNLYGQYSVHYTQPTENYSDMRYNVNTGYYTYKGTTRNNYAQYCSGSYVTGSTYVASGCTNGTSDNQLANINSWLSQPNNRLTALNDKKRQIGDSDVYVAVANGQIEFYSYDGVEFLLSATRPSTSPFAYPYNGKVYIKEGRVVRELSID